jgi:hypothetical protein
MSIYLLEVFENSTIDIPDFGLAFNNIDILLDFVEKKTKKISPDVIEFAKELKDSGVGFFLDEEENIRVTILPLVSEASETKYNNLFAKALAHHDNDKKENPNDKKDDEDDKKPNEDKGKEDKKPNEDKDKEDKKPNEDKGKDDKKHNENKGKENKNDDDDENDDDEKTVFKTGSETIEVENGTENAISDDVLEDGDTVVDFHDLIRSHTDPKLYIKKETFDKLPKQGHKVKDPYTQVPINVATTYKIKVKSKNNTRKNNLKKVKAILPIKG